MISRNRKESKKGIILSGNACVVCGWSGKNFKNETLLVGAHVRPFESGSEFDKADNIIALCPNHHAEYDGYAFTIDATTKTIICIDPNNKYNGLCIKDRIKHVKTEYLAYEQYLFNEINDI